ncbi:uncharacterized protein LOC126740593 isoform X2 [Anthonomus grandis grandis]|uniref:uncharacterized protein LOC126740593 isoform X2 n=1 Tax=Anthonomus grandis grandis TaxID=2921223 RepID=UPI0021666E36|nr:uncharacterized protein LOC126740593 isoform X2 [Anthonomus grandis grandis]
MENRSFVPDNIPADLKKSWHIPRPTLARSSHSSQGSTSSNNSTQSARSGSLLLTAANLAQIHQDNNVHTSPSSNTRDLNIQYYLERTNQDNELIASLPKSVKQPEQDNVSIASSMHFTVVNVNSRPKVLKRSCCRKHQLTILVVSMSVLFTIGILMAVYLLEMRARDQRRY